MLRCPFALRHAMRAAVRLLALPPAALASEASRLMAITMEADEHSLQAK